MQYNNAKAEVVNARVVQIMARKSNVFISRNDNFYRRGVINASLYVNDGIHVNDEGSKNLAFNTKDAICRAMDIQMKYGPRKRFPFKNRKGRYNRDDR